MGFFSSQEPQTTDLPQISQERIKDLFERDEIRYFVDSDGDLGGVWDNNIFYFVVQGQLKEILVIQGCLGHTFPISRLDEVREFINEWNREKFWPKAYYRVDDEGIIKVFGDHASDWEDGVTDEQLSLTIQCAVSTTNTMFKTIVDALAR